MGRKAISIHYDAETLLLAAAHFRLGNFEKTVSVEQIHGVFSENVSF